MGRDKHETRHKRDKTKMRQDKMRQDKHGQDKHRTRQTKDKHGTGQK